MRSIMESRGDIIVLAGKGHEDYQEIKGKKYPMDERVLIAEILKEDQEQKSMMYADIIVDISHEKLDRSFQYRVPLEMEDEIQVGMVVTIPFGNGNHERKGYVIGLSKEPELDPSKIKPLKGISSSQETTEEN